MKDGIFQIGDFTFRLCCPEEVVPPENFMKFERKAETDEDVLLSESRRIAPEYTYQIEISDVLPRPDGEVAAKRPDLVVFRSGVGESRLIGVKGRESAYACYREVDENRAEVTLVQDEIKELHIDPVFSSLLALERRMILRDSLILHCAYMVYQGKAILFSAPSGTGKSTQADLWEKYRGSWTVNGDRALLRKAEGRWNACGWPVCGSSEICNLQDTPIYGIVMLRQGKINHAERLSPIQAFSQLYTQITINQWNREFADRAMNDIEDLISSVPVWQLTCDISEEAVQCLESVLFADGMQ